MDRELEDALYNATPPRGNNATPGDKAMANTRATVVRFLEGVAELGDGGVTAEELLERLGG